MERFPGIDIEQALTNACRPNRRELRELKCGKPNPSHYFLLDKSTGAAFVIKRIGEVVLTVLKHPKIN